jgi:hypothetical protein
MARMTAAAGDIVTATSLWMLSVTAARGSTIYSSVRRGAFVPFSMRASTNSKRELHDALKGGGHERASNFRLERTGCAGRSARTLPSTNTRKLAALDGGGRQRNRAAGRVSRRSAATKMGRSAEAMVAHLDRGVVATGPRVARVGVGEEWSGPGWRFAG